MKVEGDFPTNDLPIAGEHVRRLERIGYDGVLSRETKNDPFLPLVVAALNSERMSLGTSVAIAFPRSPAVTAMMSWDLQRVSKGRFILGIGTSVKGHNERRFSVPWTGPAQPRLREYILGLKAFWNTWQTGEKLDFRGKYFTHTVMPPEFNPGPIDYPAPKVMISAVGPYMARLAGEVCDGIRTNVFSTRKYVEDVVLPAVRAGADRVGRDLSDFEVSGTGMLAYGATQAEVEQAREQIRARICFYGCTKTYHGVFEAHGWYDVGPRLTEMAIKNQWDKMAATIPDDVLDAFAVPGTPDTIVAAMKKRFGGICDRVDFTIPVKTPAEEERLSAMLRELHAISEPALVA